MRDEFEVLGVCRTPQSPGIKTRYDIYHYFDNGTAGRVIGALVSLEGELFLFHLSDQACTPPQRAAIQACISAFELTGKAIRVAEVEE